jgi:uncharacterized protein YybS (DUF2232 family)
MVENTANTHNSRPSSWAFSLALCLLGPLFFLSYAFSLLAPLPLLYLHTGEGNPNRGRLWFLGAVALGILLTTLIKGFWGGLGFFLLASLPSFLLGELLLRKKGPEMAVLGALAAILLGALSSYVFLELKGTQTIPLAKQAIELQVTKTADILLNRNPEEIPQETQDQLKQLKENPALVFEELPGFALSALFLLCILPCLALIRWNPKGFLKRTGIHRDFLRKWKSPEWLVWPSLLCGALLIFEYEPYSQIARNALKPILIIYFFQGMSILAYFLDSLRLRGPLRVMLYALGILFLTPMVVSFGFFDYWFNFRSRNRQPTEEKEP